MYRLLDNLAMPDGTIWKAGLVCELGQLSERVITALLDAQKIAVIATPPLRVLDGWQTRANQLRRRAEIERVDDLLAYDSAALAEVMGVKLETIERWKTEAVQAMKVEEV